MLRYILLTNKHLGDINPMECGEEDCAPDFHTGPTSRQYYLLHFIFKGSGAFTVNDKEYRLSKGQIFILHPYEITKYRADPDDPWHYCWIGFETTLDIPLLKDNYLLDFPKAEHIFRALKDSDMIDREKEYYICGKIFELFSMLQQKPYSKSKASEYIIKAKNYIDTNYVNPITIEQLANDLNINRSYFSTAFRKHLGRSPQQYLVDVRLDKAAELIANYGYSISAAAMSSGYTDIFNFSKMFKQKFGVSPTAYAKSIK